MSRGGCGESPFFGSHRYLVRSLANHGQVGWGMCPIAMGLYPGEAALPVPVVLGHDLPQFELSNIVFCMSNEE